jgi:alpha-1,3-mannosyltransferase
MNVLLYVPGLLVILFRSLGLFESCVHLGIIFVIQIWLGLPFIIPYPRAYFSNAFDLSRQFLYKWTVNWRFVPEDLFLSKQFSVALLVGHVGVLFIFAFTRWFKKDDGIISTVKRALSNPFVRAGWDLPSGDGTSFNPKSRQKTDHGLQR